MLIAHRSIARSKKVGEVTPNSCKSIKLNKPTDAWFSNSAASRVPIPLSIPVPPKNAFGFDSTGTLEVPVFYRQAIRIDWYFFPRPDQSKLMNG